MKKPRKKKPTRAEATAWAERLVTRVLEYGTRTIEVLDAQNAKLIAEKDRLHRALLDSSVELAKVTRRLEDVERAAAERVEKTKGE